MIKNVKGNFRRVIFVKRKISYVLLIVSLCLVMAFPIPTMAATTSNSLKNINVLLDGQRIAFPDVWPQVDANKRVLIPIRVVSENLGAKVDYENDKITIKQDDKVVVLTIGSKTATVNGKAVTFDSAAVVNNSRTLVPLRFVSEALSRRVVWDGANNTAHIWNLISDKTLEEESAKDWTEKSPAHVGYDHFTAKGGKLTFKDDLWDGPQGPFKDYKIGETITKDLAKKSYQLVKYLAGNEQYTDARYFPTTSSGTPSSLAIYYAVNSRAINSDNYYFSFVFPEKTYYESFNSKKVSIRLVVNTLFWNEENNRNVKVENKLRMSLVSLFGDNEGISIFNWVMDLYNKRISSVKEYEALKKLKTTKNFGKYQVDFDGTGVNPLTFSFTLKG